MALIPVSRVTAVVPLVVYGHLVQIWFVSVHVVSMLRFTLSNNSPTNTVLLNAEGRPVYSVRTPFKWTHKTSTIYKNILDKNRNPTDAQEELARIHRHTMRSSRLVYNGRIVDISKLMPVHGMLRRQV